MESVYFLQTVYLLAIWLLLIQTPVSMIAKVLGVELTTATSFYTRFMKNFGLPAKLKVSKSKITAAIGLAIKNSVRDSPKGLVMKSLPNEPWYPSKTTTGKYLKECGKVTKKSGRISCRAGHHGRKEVQKDT
jgi:hypothetical protein